MIYLREVNWRPLVTIKIPNLTGKIKINFSHAISDVNLLYLII